MVVGVVVVHGFSLVRGGVGKVVDVLGQFDESGVEDSDFYICWVVEHGSIYVGHCAEVRVDITRGSKCGCFGG